MNRMLAGLLVAGFLFTNALYAQEPENATDPLFLRDDPVFVGWEETAERLHRLKEERGALWALNLSGGSARAFAHVGVLKRLEEEGLRPDIIITNSMGSIIGLSYAAGMSLADLEYLVREINLAELFELQISTQGGWIELSRFLSFYSYLIGDGDISRFPIPVFVVQEDLKSKRTTVLSEGPFPVVLQSSFALPFYFEPVDYKGFRLIDGGVSNLVPLRPFADRIQNMVVSSAFNNAAVNLNNPLTILNVAMDISKGRDAVEDLETYKPFLIRGDVEEISFMAFDEGEAILKAGYDSCDKIIEPLLQYLQERGIRPEPDLKPLPQAEAIHGRLEAWKPFMGLYLPPYQESNLLLQIGGEIFKQYGSRYVLMQENYLAGRAIFRAGRHQLELNLLYDEQGRGGGLFRYSLNLGVLQNRLEIFHGINYTSEITTVLAADYFMSDQLSLLLSPPPFRLTFHLEGELYGSLGNPPPATLFQGGIEAEWSGSGRKTGISKVMVFSDSHLRWRSPSLQEPVLSVAQDLRCELEWREAWSLKLRGYGRKALGDDSAALLGYNDFYRSARFTSLTRNRKEFYPDYLIFNSAIHWRIGKYSPTLGEILQPSQTSFYLFGDLFWQEPELEDLFDYEEWGQMAPVFGAGLKLEASLIGLTPYKIHFIGGYDIAEESLFFTWNWKSSP